MQFTLTPYGLDAWQRGLRLAPETAKREMLVAVTEATLLLEADLKEGPPGSHYPYLTGTTMRSITPVAFSTPVGVLGLVGSPSPVAAFLALGTKYMKARPSFPAALARQQSKVLRMFEDAAGRIAKRLGEMPGGAA